MDPVRASNTIMTVVVAVIMLLTTPVLAAELDARLAEAESLRQQAAQAGYEWLETAALLEQARTEMENGSLENALALIEKARFQAEAALLQASHEAEAWRSRVVR
jgi:hypothetical protein